jgi:hypothetical protein
MEMFNRRMESGGRWRWTFWVGVTAYVLLTFAWICCIAWNAIFGIAW